MGLETKGEVWNEYMHCKVIAQMENEAGTWMHSHTERVRSPEKGGQSLRNSNLNYKTLSVWGKYNGYPFNTTTLKSLLLTSP